MAQYELRKWEDAPEGRTVFSGFVPNWELPVIVSPGDVFQVEKITNRETHEVTLRLRISKVDKDRKSRSKSSGGDGDGL